MVLLETVAPEKAEGAIKEGYDVFLQNGMEVPVPLQLTSASPALFKMTLQRLHYYGNHPNLGFALLAHIRYLVACELDYGYCRQFNAKLLKRQGMEENELDQIQADPSLAPLEDHERLMLQFVSGAMKDPAAVGRKDIDTLHAAGWKDSDIFDAMAQAVSMKDHQFLLQVFDGGSDESHL